MIDKLLWTLLWAEIGFVLFYKPTDTIEMNRYVSELEEAFGGMPIDDIFRRTDQLFLPYLKKSANIDWVNIDWNTAENMSYWVNDYTDTKLHLTFTHGEKKDD